MEIIQGLTVKLFCNFGEQKGTKKHLGTKMES